MSCKLNSDAYIQLINEDIDWLLLNTQRSLERDHIIGTLKWSVLKEYDFLDKKDAMQKLHG